MLVAYNDYNMNKTKKAFHKIVILAVGVPVLVLGIILVPLPGPGLLVVLLGLIILSQEFEWADRHVHKIKGKVKEAGGYWKKKVGIDKK